MEDLIHTLRDPEDYFVGIQGSEAIQIPDNLLIFHRATVETLQQNALQNRSHHRFVLIFNLGTAGHVHVNHRLVSFETNKALLIFPFQFHHFSQLQEQTLSWLFLTFELKDDRPLAVMRNRVISLRAEILQEVNVLLNDWREIISRPDAGSVKAEILRAGVWRLLMVLKNETLSQADDIPPEPRDNLLRTVHQILLGSSGRVVRIQDLAERLNLSEPGLRQKFKQVSGLPLGQYLQNFRINRAMSLLQSTRQSIADVAEESGFASPQAFSRSFKQEVGVSPQQYRKQRS